MWAGWLAGLHVGCIAASNFSSRSAYAAMRRDFTKEWKNGKLVFCTKEPDLRNYDERPRVRHRLRPNCKECVKQSLCGLAHNDAWCKRFCKMHAGQKGLKDPKGKKSHKAKVKKETKVKVKKEPKVTAEATITNGADEGAAGCSIPNRSKRLTRFGCPLLNKPRDAPKAIQMTVKRKPETKEDDARPPNVKVHPYIQLHRQYTSPRNAIGHDAKRRKRKMLRDTGSERIARRRQW